MSIKFSIVFVLGALTLGASGRAAAADCGYADMKGEVVTFKETFPGGEHYGYQSWHKKPEVPSKPLPYAQYVGRSGKPTEGVISDRLGITKFRKVVLDNCEVVYAHLVAGQMPENVYSALDLDIAKLLVGKTIWVNQNDVVRPQTLATLDRGVAHSLAHLEPLTVTDLYLRGIGHAFGSGPFYLKAKKATGEEGYIAFNTRYFETSNPVPANTPKAIVAAIQERKVVLGMSADQLRLSWGKPQKVNTSVGSWGVKEQWVYGNGQYVYVENGKVTSFQTAD